MSDNISSNKRIAKNTIMLYIRMLLSMVVSLYTSRVVLNTLGVEDYGIYGVVGGVVALFGFLNASMSGATSRFLTYEIGRDDFLKLKETFNAALIVHFAIAIIVFVLAETIGLWILIEKLVLPKERMFAAHVVYQLSIFSSMISITQVPYNSAIMSHEKMDIYAYVELLNVTLKLLIVFLLPILGNDKLIVYACLVLVVSILIAFIYRFYCIRHYKETHFRFIYKKDLFYQILSFSGYDLYGNLGARIYQQGTSMLLNVFFGVLLNTASSIATTVQGVVSSFSGNILLAFRPVIIKLYAQKNMVEMIEKFQSAMLFSSILMIVVVVPFTIHLPYIMNLWLGMIPEYAVDICRILLLTSILNQMQMTCNIVIHATGKIKGLSFFTGTIFALSVIGVYFLFKVTLFPISAYYFFIFVHVTILINDFRLIKKYISIFSYKIILIKVLLPTICLLCFNYFALLCFNYYVDIPIFIKVLLTFLISIFLILSLSYLFIMTKEQKVYLIRKLCFVK